MGERGDLRKGIGGGRNEIEGVVKMGNTVITDDSKEVVELRYILLVLQETSSIMVATNV